MEIRLLDVTWWEMRGLKFSLGTVGLGGENTCTELCTPEEMSMTSVPLTVYPSQP